MPQMPEKRCPHCTECSSEHLGGQKITARNAATGKKTQPKAPRCPATASTLPQNTSLKLLGAPRSLATPPQSTSPKHINTSRKFFGTLRQPQHLSTYRELLCTMRQHQHPANLDTLCMTKCHYLSFGKCFDIIRSVPSEMTDRMK